MPYPTFEEIDTAFYRSYGEGTAAAEPALFDRGARRALTLAEADEPFVACWLETQRLLIEANGAAPLPSGFSLSGPVILCQQPAVNPDRPKYEPLLWNDHDPATAAHLDLFAWADDAAARKARTRSLAAPNDAAAAAAADAADETARVSAAAALHEGAIQLSTNCYAYATNSRVGHPKGQKPQPGERSGARAASSACPAVSAAVVRDGAPDNIRQAERCPYNKQQRKPPPDRPGYYLVALVSTSKPSGYDAVDGVEYVNDYHWYRQDDNGRWSHKPGLTKVVNTDSAGNVILNPETANRRTVYPGQAVHANQAIDQVVDYDNFCGYFYVKKGGAPVGN